MPQRTELDGPREEASRVATPIRLSKEKEKAFARWLSLEIAEARRQRTSYDDKLIKWRKQYEAVPEVEEKIFPWKGCSNVVAPLIGIVTDALSARIESDLIGRPDFCQAKVIRPDPEWQKIAERLERYLNHAAKQENDLDTENAMRDLIHDCVLNGTSFLKIPYVYEEQYIPERIEDGKINFRKIVSHNGPKHVWVSVFDMLWPDGTYDIQKSRWLAQRVMLEWYQLVERSKNPLFGYSKDAIANVENHFKQNIPKEMLDLYGIIGFSFAPKENLELYEVYVKADFENPGEYKEYIVTIHPESESILRIIRLFYAHGKRPFVQFFYNKRTGIIVAQGVGSMLERIQDGITASLNQMIDNATAANTIVLKARKGSLKATEEIYPMKKLMLDDINDVEQFRIGEQLSGVTATISALRDYAERRSGVTDYHLGLESPDVGTRATATGTMSLIQEGNRLIDARLRAFRLSMNEGWQMTVQTYQQFAPIRKIVGVLGEDAGDLIETFNFPPEWIFDKIAITVSQSSSSANREIEKQNSMNLFNLLMGYYQKVVDVAAIYGSPQLPPVAKVAIDKSIRALNELLEKILKSFETYNVEDFMIVLSEIERQMGGQLHGAGNNGGGAGGLEAVLPRGASLPPSPELAGGQQEAGGGGISP
jgi:hypothetical protein